MMNLLNLVVCSFLDLSISFDKIYGLKFGNKLSKSYEIAEKDNSNNTLNSIHIYLFEHICF